MIDLDRGSLKGAVFRLSFELVVPDLLYEREMRPHGGDDSLAHGLRVVELEGNGVARALGLPTAAADSVACRRIRPCSCGTKRLVVLTGDRVLRNLANSEGAACHGLLWVLDQMTEAGISDPLCAILRAQRPLGDLRPHARQGLFRREEADDGGPITVWGM